MLFRRQLVFLLLALISFSLYLLVSSTIQRWHSHSKENWLKNFPNQSYYDEILSKEPEEWVLQTPPWSRKTEVLILAVSKYSERETRNEIRRSWAAKNNSYIRSKRVSVVFLLGHDGDGISKYQDEYNRHKDLFFVDVVDEYKNLVFKETMAYRYISAALPKAHLVKMDTDCLLDINGLMEFMDTRRDPNTIYGSHLVQTKPVRDPNHKWFISEKLFAPEIFPDYVMGIFYIISAPALKALVSVSPNAKVLELEDCFWTGILRSKTEKVKVANLPEFEFYMPDMKKCPTEKQRNYFTVGFEGTKRVTIEESYKKLIEWKEWDCDPEVENNRNKKDLRYE